METAVIEIGLNLKFGFPYNERNFVDSCCAGLETYSSFATMTPFRVSFWSIYVKRLTLINRSK